MRTLTLLLVLVALPLTLSAQEPDAAEGSRIAAVRVTGIRGDLSPGLQDTIDALVGTPLDWGTLGVIAERIEAERPRVIAAVRALRTPEGDARVLFLAAVADDEEQGWNVNGRYTIERVAIDGVPDTDISQALRDDLQALVGTRVTTQARRLTERLRAELPGYDVDRRVSRGTRRGQVVVTYEVRKGESMRWVPFAPIATKFLYHQDQGWSGLLDLPIHGGNIQVTPRLAFDNRDDLVEEYSGIGLRLEAREIGSERVGLTLEASRYDPSWHASTLAALSANPRISGLYDTRLTVAPSATVALTRRLRATAGVSVTELEPVVPGASSQMASAFTASIGYRQQWRQGARGHDLEASVSIRSAADALGTDLDYTRVVGQGLFRHHWRERSTVIATVNAGRIGGQAPLFERFTLGDSSTLRGWNKYDIAPVGGDRLFHASVEYRYQGAAFFVDTGSVWQQAAASDMKVSTGFGYHRDNFFATLGFPLNADSVGGTFMIGVKF